jgi:D-3-phosphoglycerate dehydrogenase
MTPRLVVLEDDYGDAELEAAAARRLGVDVDLRPCGSPDEVVDAAAGADGILVRNLPVTAALLDRLPGVRVVGRYGVGVDMVDVAGATDRGVAVVHVPDYGTAEVAEHTAALILAAWRRLPQGAELVARGRWNDWQELAPIPPLSECTLGLVGAGRIGGELVRRIGGLFARVLVHDPYAAALPHGTEAAGLAELAAGADVVSLHCPLTPQTHHLVDSAFLARMRPRALLVNVARGGLVDTRALLTALDAGRPAMAALDVLETEPPDADDPVVGHPRVLHTPHVAWYSTRALARLRTLLAERCAARLLGMPGATLANPEVDGPTPTPNRRGAGMTPEDVLAEMGLALPPAPVPVANYLTAKRAGDLLFVSGQTPVAHGGHRLRGLLGDGVSVEQGQQGAASAVLACLAAAREHLGGLDRVASVVKLTGYVASTPEFDQQPAVVNGASILLEQVFGERGRHARAAVGVAALPGGAPVEVELVLEVGGG